MKFGKNDNVNYFEPSEESGSENTESNGGNTESNGGNTGSDGGNTGSSPVSKELKSIRTEPKTNESELILLITTIASGVLISKFIV